jgi:hypothetical protein
MFSLLVTEICGPCFVGRRGAVHFRGEGGSVDEHVGRGRSCGGGGRSGTAANGGGQTLNAADGYNMGGISAPHQDAAATPEVQDTAVCMAFGNREFIARDTFGASGRRGWSCRGAHGRR